MNRRHFLQVTGAAGLLIAFRIPDRRGVVPFAPNAWLQVGTDGVVTLTIDKSEMGEGNHTALAMLIAEELDADWTKVKIGAVPDNPAGWSRRMSTGGSTSVRTSWDILRKAGATARAMLVAAAAQTWGAEPSACSTENGVVSHTGTSHRLTYGELAEKAASIPVPASPPLKDPKDFRLLGKPTHRLDTPSKVNGTAQFGIDVRMPGMLVASIERSPVFGGKVKSFDATRAKAQPGVRHVVQIDGTPWTGTGGAWGVGNESGVAVVADTYWQAVQGRQALQISWDEGPNAALGAIPGKLAALAGQTGVTARSVGDAAATLAGASKKVEAVYEVPFLHHATMEPMNCTAHVRADGCDVWAPTQNQTRAQEVAAEAAGLPKEKVRIHTTLLGGGFGRRLESDFVAEAVRLSKAAGVPVKVIWSREDDTKHGFYRPATYNRLAAGLDAQNKPIAWTHHIVAPPILLKFGPLQNGIDGTLIDGAADVPYAFPNVFVDQVAAELPGIPLGFWRSVGASQNAFVVECFMDEVAAAAGRDPYASHPGARGDEGGLGHTPSRRSCTRHRDRRMGANGLRRSRRRFVGAGWNRAGPSRGMRRRLRPGGEPRYARGADAGRRRVRAVGRAVWRDHDRERPGEGGQLQRLPGAAHPGDAGRRGAHRSQYRRVGRNRRAVRPADRARGM